MNNEEFKELQDRFDQRYKQIKDCDTDMTVVTEAQHKHDVSLALINQQLSIIKWISTCTLGAVIAAIVGLIVSRIGG